MLGAGANCLDVGGQSTNRLGVHVGGVQQVEFGARPESLADHLADGRRHHDHDAFVSLDSLRHERHQAGDQFVVGVVEERTV